MIVAVGALCLLDACIKLLTPHYSSLQIACMRGVSALPFAITWVGLSGGFGQLRRIRWRLHLLRGVIGIMMLVCFAYALRNLALAEAYSIFFIAPILITCLAVLLLKEQVEWQRWVAVGVGFAGVLIVLRPTGKGALTLPGLAVLATAIGYALSAILIRVIGRTDTTQSMVFSLMSIVAIVAGILALPSWRPIESTDWIILLGMVVSGSIGQFAITEAFRVGESSFLAPFEYTALAWGLGLDWFIWNTLPALLTMVGASVIIISGVYLVRHERVHVEAEHP